MEHFAGSLLLPYVIWLVFANLLNYRCGTPTLFLTVQLTCQDEPSSCLTSLKPRCRCQWQLVMAPTALRSVWKNNPAATAIIEPLRDSAPNPGSSGYEGSNATVCIHLLSMFWQCAFMRVRR